MRNEIFPARIIKDFTDNHGVTYWAGEAVDLVYESGVFKLIMGFKAYSPIPEEYFKLIPFLKLNEIVEDKMGVYETVIVKQLRKEFQEMEVAYVADKISLREIMELCYELGAKEAEDIKEESK
jgi:hypothetical protein